MRLNQMTEAQKKQLARKLFDLKESEHWGVIDFLEQELYERKKSLLASIGFYDGGGGEGQPIVRKDIGQFALDMASAQGGIKHDHEMKALRNNLLELLKEEEKKDGDRE